MAKRKRHEQTSIPGTEVAENPDVRDALHAWLDAKDEQRRNSKAVKMAHDVLIGHMQEAKIERYPYVDSITGKKKHVLADRTAHAKVINAPRGTPKNDNERERPAIDAVIADPNADKVESRRVSRESVEAEIAEALTKVQRADDADKPIKLAGSKLAAGADDEDPFERVRNLMATPDQNADSASDAGPFSETEH